MSSLPRSKQNLVLSFTPPKMSFPVLNGMNHLQPATPIQTNNVYTTGISNKTRPTSRNLPALLALPVAENKMYLAFDDTEFNLCWYGSDGILGDVWWPQEMMSWKALMDKAGTPTLRFMMNRLWHDSINIDHFINANTSESQDATFKRYLDHSILSRTTIASL